MRCSITGKMGLCTWRWGLSLLDWLKCKYLLTVWHHFWAGMLDSMKKEASNHSSFCAPWYWVWYGQLLQHLWPQLPYHDGLYPRNDGQNKPLLAGITSYIPARKNKNIPPRRPSAYICSQEPDQPNSVRVELEGSLMRVCKAKRWNTWDPAAVVAISTSLPWRFGGFCKRRSVRDKLIYYIGKLRGWRVFKERTQQNARLGTGRAVNLQSY